MALANVVLFCPGTRAFTGEGPVRTVGIRILGNYGLSETWSKLPSKKTWCERREKPLWEKARRPQSNPRQRTVLQFWRECQGRLPGLLISLTSPRQRGASLFAYLRRAGIGNTCTSGVGSCRAA